MGHRGATRPVCACQTAGGGGEPRRSQARVARALSCAAVVSGPSGDLRGLRVDGARRAPRRGCARRGGNGHRRHAHCGWHRQQCVWPRPRHASGGRDRRRPPRADGAGRDAARQRSAMILRRTAAYLWPYRWRVAVALLQVALISALEVLKPWPLQIVIDSVLGGKAPAWRLFVGLSPATLLAVAVGGLVLIYILLGLMAVWNNYTPISIVQGMVNDLRSRFSHPLQCV